MKYKRGKYTPKNPSKYRGNINNIEYRSSWELYVFNWLDRSKDVVAWNSEEIVIPYWDSTLRKKRKYYLDVYCMLSNGNEFFGEIKPKIKLTSKHKNQIETKNIMEKAKATINVIKKINKEQNRNIQFIFITD